MTAYDEDIKRRDELGKAYARGYADGMENGLLKATRLIQEQREKARDQATELRSEGGGQD